MKLVRLELVRHGPNHNQLLSPLTQYLALCENNNPLTIHVGQEHLEFLYQRRAATYIQNDERLLAHKQAALRGLENEVTQIFESVRGLGLALHQAEDDLVHLRLVVPPLELAALPFELARAPSELGGGSLPLLLGEQRVVLTRAIRRHSNAQVKWPEKPKILFIWAGRVPHQAHLTALVKALKPWLPAEHELGVLKKHLTVLADATLEDIQRAAGKDEYTHIHLLAHGVERHELGIGLDGYRLALNGLSGEVEHVDSGALVAALVQGHTIHRPTVVSLAVCDGGSVGSVLNIGGSIAHALSEAGVPWVVGSQMPLSFEGSAILADELYCGLLDGRDPRRVLYRVRSGLRSKMPPEAPDWAALVAYDALPHDIETQMPLVRWRRLTRGVDGRLAGLMQVVKSELKGESSAESPAWSIERKYLNDFLEMIEKIARGQVPRHVSDPRIAVARAHDFLGSATLRWLDIVFLIQSAEESKRVGLASRYLSQEKIGEFEDGILELSDTTRLVTKARYHYKRAFLADPTRFWALAMDDQLAWILGDQEGVRSEDIVMRLAAYPDAPVNPRQLIQLSYQVLKLSQGKIEAGDFLAGAKALILEIGPTTYEAFKLRRVVDRGQKYLALRGTSSPENENAETPKVFQKFLNWCDQRGVRDFWGEHD